MTHPPVDRLLPESVLAQSAGGSLRLSLQADLELREALREAGARGEWHLVYQPKVLAKTRRIETVEALLRWEHPTLGAVPPDRFVAVAEAAGMMGELTRWVLSEALDAQARWRAAGISIPVAVNVSAQLVGDFELLGWLDEQFAALNLAPSCLTIEITETAVMADPDVACRFLTAIRALGMRVSVDDFGTGYTSLSVLAHLPLDELKIDRSFVIRSATSTADEAVIRSVRELGHRLGLDVVAEGVEDEQTAQRLTEFGVDILQGYLFSKPLTEEALGHFVAADRSSRQHSSGQLNARSEANRIAALYRYGILDSEADAGLDDITALAAHICDTPIALVTLVDIDRQHLASHYGVGRVVTPRSDSFCAHALSGTEFLEVNDARADERFAANPLVIADPGIRFYAGAPLRTADGHTLGTLCVIDRKPRSLTNAQRRALASLSRTVMRQLETRRISLVTARLPSQLRELLNARAAGNRAQAEQLQLRMCTDFTLCDLAVILSRMAPDWAFFTVTSSITDPSRAALLDDLRIDTRTNNTLAAALEHKAALFFPEVTTSPHADHSIGELLNLRAIHIQPIVNDDQTIDSAILAGWERPTENINPFATEILAAVAVVLGMIPAEPTTR